MIMTLIKSLPDDILTVKQSSKAVGIKGLFQIKTLKLIIMFIALIVFFVIVYHLGRMLGAHIADLRYG